MKTLLCTAALAAMVSVQAQAREVWGTVRDFTTGSDALVRFDSTDPTSVTVVGDYGLGVDVLVTGLDFSADGRLWGSGWNTATGELNLHEFDTTNGAVLSTVAISNLQPGTAEVDDLAYNPLTGKMHLVGVDSSFSATNIHEIDLMTGIATHVLSRSATDLGIAFTSNGDMYLEDITGDQIDRYDSSFGLIGSVALGFDANFSQGIGADWSNDDKLMIGAWNLSASTEERAQLWEFNADLTGLSFLGLVDGLGTPGGFQRFEVNDVAFLPIPAPGGGAALFGGLLLASRRRR